MVKVYIEGGGDNRSLLDECREGFRKFLEKAGLSNSMPRLVACGCRNDAFDKFCTALKQNEEALLLVDSEVQVDAEYKGKDGDDRVQGKSNDYTTWKPFEFLANRDGWSFDDKKVPLASRPRSTDGHLMVCCMESWLVSDIDNLARFYGQGFNDKPLSAIGTHPETTNKESVYSALSRATMQTKTKGKYGKGPHSFKILATTNPDVVTKVSPWAKRFIECLKERMKTTK